MQDKAVLGKRYTCFKCSTKFYDLNRTEPTCPKCGADQREDPTPDPKIALLQKGNRPPARGVQAPAKAAEAEAEPDEDADFDMDEDLDEEEFSDGEIEEEEEEEPEEEGE